jgi:hypothetical protein
MISVLFCSPRSVYNKFEGIAIYDRKRDAFTFNGKGPVICHPPCAQWSRLRNLAKHNLSDKSAAVFCLNIIRCNGGILEHPAGSVLWRTLSLPKPGGPPDVFGGYSLSIRQVEFGHHCVKQTWLYICRIPKDRFTLKPFPGRKPTHSIRFLKNKNSKLLIASSAIRNNTPLLFAQWLLQAIKSIDQPT